MNLDQIFNEDGTVDARRLHSALNVGRDFPTWIAQQLVKYEWEKGFDYTVKSTDRGKGLPVKEYSLSIPMAGELALHNRTAHGREIRRCILQKKAPCNCKHDKQDVAPVEQKAGLKACLRCLTPFKGDGELCMVCVASEERGRERQAMVNNRAHNVVSDSPFVECLIKREGNTTMTAPVTGNVYVFRKNSRGASVAEIRDPRDHANILKSNLYRPYVEES